MPLITTKTSNKIIEAFRVVVSTNGQPLAFENILLSDPVKNELLIRGKDVTLRILEQGAHIVGIVETTRRDNIPPKKNQRKAIEKIGLLQGEGLAYGNIFLYEKKRRILLYEVNRFGCYVNHFLEFLTTACVNDNNFDPDFSLDINTILKPDQYERMQNMNYYKSLEIKFANPKELSKAYKHKNDSFAKIIDMNKKIHSETFSCVFEVRSKKRGGLGLSNTGLQAMVKNISELLGTEAGSINIQRFNVSGYAQDSHDGDKIEPIDMLADRYIKYIQLDEPRENSDLLEHQRKTEISKLYYGSKDDFTVLFGN